MLPKLCVTIYEAILHARLDSRAMASGYSHTHSDTRGLDIPVLATFPNDNKIDTAAKEAADEAESLLALLGILPKQLQQNSTIILPSINSLQAGNGADQEDEQNDKDSMVEDDVTVSEAQELQNLVQRNEENKMLGLSQLAEAVALVTTDECMRMCISRTEFSLKS